MPQAASFLLWFLALCIVAVVLFRFLLPAIFG